MKSNVDVVTVEDAERAELLTSLLRREGLSLPIPFLSRPLVIRPRANALPLSYAQERLWFLEQLGLVGSAYNVPMALRLAGTLDRDALERSFGEVVRRHEALRTRFVSEDGRGVQVIDAPGAFRLEMIDLGGLEAEEQTTKVDRLTREHADRCFELACDALLRATLLRLGAEDHVVLVNMHHIVSDAWSTGVLIGEIGALYAAYRQRRPSPLGELAIQYADYALWQREWLQGEALARQIGYWKARLAGAPAALELPADRPRPAVQSYAGGAVAFALPQGLSSGLAELSRRAGVTLYMVLLAAFQVLLKRYSGQHDIVVGSPIAGRQRQEFEGLIGFFVNMLAMRTDLSGDPSFSALLGIVKETCLGAYGHQDLPFEKLVEELAPVRDLSRPPVFQVVFALQNMPDALQLPGLRLSRAGGSVTTSKVDLTLFVQETAQGLRGHLEYATDLFERATIERLAGHYGVLLEGIVAAPERRLSELELLTDGERRQLVEEWNDTAAEYPREACLHELFAAQAARTPDAVAVVCEDRRLSYGEIDARSNRLAHHLRALGVGPEVVVGLCAERSPETLVGLLGILKAGGAYLPLDPSYPAERLAYMLADARVPVLLTQAALRDALPAHDAHIVLLDADWSTVEREAATPPPNTAHPDNLAYLIYTSGSTGKPKGVMGSHRIVVNRIAAQERIDPFTDQDIAVQKTSLSFVNAVFETLGPLLNGRPLLIVSRDTGADAVALADALNRHRVTRLIVVPSLLRELLSLPGADRSLSGLRSVTVSGEAVDGDVLRRFFDVLPDGRLINLYGSSEVAGDATGTPLSREGSSAPIGRPLGNTQVYVLDAELGVAPVGVAGELYIGGAGLARGYLGRPDLTAERFVPGPFGEGERLYRSGDLARWRADGALEYLGRIDHQVKLRGYRIELGEIEAALSAHAAVAQAVVVAREDAPGDKRLAAYVVGAPEAVPDAAALRAHLRQSLPDHMVPSAFVVLDALPLTPSGKVDRRALPAPEGRPEAGAYVAPATPVEEALCAIWCEVLKLDRVGVTDNFFELGGHSLLAMRLVSLTRERLGLAPTLRNLFDAPTVSALAVGLAAAGAAVRRENRDTALPDPAARFEPFPLTEIQEAYWIGRRAAFALGHVAAHGYFEMESADIDLTRLTRALNRTIERQHMLRAIILPSGKQKVLPQVPPYEVVTDDLTSVSEREAEARLLALRKRMSHAILDAERWPLFEIRASRLREGRVRLHVGFDMLIMDAWSYQVFLRDLAAFYADAGAELPELTFGFRDYVCARAATADDVREEQASVYWRERVAELPSAPPLPFRILPEEIEAPRFERWSSVLEPQLWERLQARARSVGVTPAIALMAAFAEILAAFSGSSHFILNLVIFNRVPVHPDVAHIIGDFTAMSVLEVDARESTNFAGLARRLQDRVWQDLDHGAVSGIRVLRDMTRARGGASVLVPVVFTSLLGLSTGGAIRAFPAELRLLDAITQTPQVALDCQVSEQDGGLSIAWDVVAALFHDNFIHAMFDRFVARLRQLADDDDAWSARSPALVPAAQIATRQRVNASDQPTADVLLDGLFVSQAERTPDAVAIVTPDLELTYGDLAWRSRSIASRLLEYGIVQGALVAVVMDKGWEQVAAVLGVLRAGAAYLPIDPTLPVERLRALLAHGEVGIALTQRRLANSLNWPEHVTCLFVEADEEARVHASPPTMQRRTDDLAYVIYTSGSTGVPKGVMIDHRGAVNTVLDVNRRFGVRPDDRVLALSSLSFDLSVYDIFGPLAVGGTIVIPDSWTRPDPAPWARLMLDRGVTIWNSVPALLEIYVQHLEAGHASRPGALRTVMLSGDWIPVNLPDRIQALKGDITVISLGGATEASIWSIYHQIERVEDHWTSIPYGRPLANQSIHVLDDALRPCPDWVTGEIFIGGIGLALGYWRDPEKTAERFIVHPQTAERLYRTGDLGRFLPNGEIEFLGRRDFQVKIQGHRVELGEIEAALLKHAAVANAVVTAEGADRGGKRLVAYVVGWEGVAPEPAALREHLTQSLPDYMVPSAFVLLDALPLTPNGKVDRRALPAPEGRPEIGAYVAPRTPAEEAMCSIWREVLKLERVGVTDNFFELGGHSMLAMQLIAQLRAAFGIELSLRALFEAPSIEELAAQIANPASGRSDRSALTAAKLPIITPDLEGRYEPFPLNDIQEAYWIGRGEGFILGNVAAYSYAEFEGIGLNVRALNAAWQKLIERHDMLRAVVLPDGLQQILAQAPAYQFPIHDLQQMPQDAAERELLTTRQRLSHQVLPTDRWPLFTIEASLLPHGRVRVHFGIDIIICDAWSRMVLQRELALLYRDLNADLPPLLLSFRDYVQAERALKDSEFHQAAWDYWSSRFSEMPPAPALPLATKPESIAQPRFGQLRGRLERNDWRRIRAHAEKAGVTPTAVMLCVYADVLAQFSGETRFTLNLTVFNRLPLHGQVNNIVGDFTSLLPLVVDNREAAPFAVRAQRIQQQLWNDLDHRLMSGVRIARERARETGARRSGMLPVVFTSTLGMPTLDEDEQLASLGELVANSNQTPQVWLDLQLSETHGELFHAWAYVDGLFPGGMIELLFEAFCNELNALAENSESWSRQHLAGLPQAQLEQRQRANATDRPIADARLEDLFLAQARARGNAPAVIAANKTINYGELERHSLAVAGRVLEAGRASPRMVGVVMEKGWEQVVAVLGVLRAGGAYVPLDPALPTERLHDLLADCGIGTVLTQARCEDKVIWPTGIRRIVVDRERPAARNQKLELPPGSPDDLAYVIHTSGSTGQPKGVMISHRGAVNTILDVNEKGSVSERDRLLSVSSLSFDLSVYDIFGTLAAGAAIVLPEPSSHPEPSRWVDAIIKNQVTLWNSVPALLELMLEQAEAGGTPLKLRLAMLSGDWIALTLPDRLRRTAHGALLLAMGGATEASIWSNYKWVDDVDPQWASIPYGRPLANQRFHVLNNVLQPCPVWTPGELYIGGAGLALGYWRDDERTKERFVVHPQTGERLYRTGDLGRYLPDGEIEFLGRQDNQVKISGHRIELGEIEHALHQHPAISGCVITATGEARGQKALLAYVVPKPDHTVVAEDIRQFLRQKLPSHMVPNQIILLDRLPLTSNGKIDRRALPTPEKADRGAPDEGAVTQTQQALLKIWTEVLNAEQIGIHDDFFQCGGDSLLAMRVAARIRERFKLTVSTATMFECPTIAELAQFIDKGANRRAEAVAVQGAFGTLSTMIPAIDIITDPLERERFKAREFGLRRFPESDHLANLSGTLSGEKSDIDTFRRNSRHFAKNKVSLESFSSVLKVLRRWTINGKRKYGYPSAGGLYPVQTYVHVRETGQEIGVEGVSEGAYYYSPAKGGLHPITPGAKLDRTIHGLLNRPVFDQASFTLFLVAELQAIMPIYGIEGLRMACLETGMMSQSLDEAAHANGIGICHVGAIAFDSCKSIFALGETHLLLHAMMGGRLTPYTDADGWSFIDESARNPAVSSEWEEWVI